VAMMGLGPQGIYHALLACWRISISELASIAQERSHGAGGGPVSRTLHSCVSGFP